jgi:hypothetical protein
MHYFSVPLESFVFLCYGIHGESGSFIPPRRCVVSYTKVLPGQPSAAGDVEKNNRDMLTDDPP